MSTHSESYQISQADFEGTMLEYVFDLNEEKIAVTLTSLIRLLGYPSIRALMDSAVVQERIDMVIHIMGCSPIYVYPQANHTAISLWFLLLEDWQKLKYNPTEPVADPLYGKPRSFQKVIAGSTEAIRRQSTWSADEMEALFLDTLVWDEQRHDWIASVDDLATLAFDPRTTDDWSSRLRNTLEFCQRHHKNEFWLEVDTPVLSEENRQSLIDYTKPLIVVSPNR